jgi:hypothetical protein
MGTEAAIAQPDPAMEIASTEVGADMVDTTNQLTYFGLDVVNPATTGLLVHSNNTGKSTGAIRFHGLRAEEARRRRPVAVRQHSARPLRLRRPRDRPVAPRRRLGHAHRRRRRRDRAHLASRRRLTLGARTLRRVTAYASSDRSASKSRSVNTVGR